MRTLQGMGVADGIALGPATCWRQPRLQVDLRRERGGEAGPERERLEQALARTRDELLGLRGQLEGRLGEEGAAILDAQVLLLDDEDFLEAVHHHIEVDGLDAAAAFARALGEALVPLDLSADDLFRERMEDLRDVEQRVLRTLAGGDATTPSITAPCILVASVLTPSQVASLQLEHVRGFVLEEGGANSHTAIIARSLGVPCVVGVRGLPGALHDGVELGVDGAAGRVHLEPDAETAQRLRTRARRLAEVGERLSADRDLPATTTDGHRVGLLANVELPLEIALARRHGAEGIGLLRTEFFYFGGDTLPGEDEQYARYRAVLEEARMPVVMRVLDVGGDKFLGALGGHRDSNPFLGWRGSRFLLSNRPVLRAQLRALYRAAVHGVGPGSVRLLFPMVNGLEELRELRAECDRAVEELRAEGVEHAPGLPVGAMIETPAAVAMAPELAAHCDFFSIGSNDLTQYVLAVDRSSRQVAHLYRAEHPAVLRSIQAAIDAGHAAGIEVSLCGEMASEPRLAALLVGMGIDALSANAAALPRVRKAVRSLDRQQAATWAREALALDSADAVDHYLRGRAFGRLRKFLHEDDEHHG